MMSSSPNPTRDFKGVYVIYSNLIKFNKFNKFNRLIYNNKWNFLAIFSTLKLQQRWRQCIIITVLFYFLFFIFYL